MGNPQGLLADRELLQSVHWLDVPTGTREQRVGYMGEVPTVQSVHQSVAMAVKVDYRGSR